MTVSIIKRDGRRQAFSSDKIAARLKALQKPEHMQSININLIVESVETALTGAGDVAAAKINTILAQKTAALAIVHPHYDVLAGQVELSTIYKYTPNKFSTACNILGNGPNALLTPTFMKDAKAHEQYLDLLVKSTPVFAYSYSAIREMRIKYLLKHDGKLVERPAYMWMRIAIHLHQTNVIDVARTFQQLSQHYFIHDTAVLLNSGTYLEHLSSNFTISLNSPLSPKGFYNSLAQCGIINNLGGEIGIGVNSAAAHAGDQNIYLRRGLRPVIELLNASLGLDVSTDSGREPAISVYLEPWHSDIFRVLDMIRERVLGDTQYDRSVRTVLWVPDLFMRRVHQDQDWSLFSPADANFLVDKFGGTFDAVYAAYESNPHTPKEKVKARLLMDAITRCLIDTNEPAIMFKDSVNRKNNLSHLGTITHGGPNQALTQYSNAGGTGVTHSASIILPSYVQRRAFNFRALHCAVESMTTNLNILIDKMSFPTPHSRVGNDKQRSIAIGVQGLAQTFILLDMPYDSQSAKELNHRIFETIYHAASYSSVSYAQLHGCGPSYANSPLSKGSLQPDLWGHVQDNRYFDWDALRQRALTYGAANSLLVALPPTWEYKNMTGCSNSFEPIDSNIVNHISHSHEYSVISPLLVDKLSSIGIWNEDMKEKIIGHKGSVQGIPEIPDYIKAIFRTAFELGPLSVIDMAADRSPYICHSQHLILRVRDPSMAKVMSLLFLAWRAGLKTGVADMPVQRNYHISPRAPSPGESNVSNHATRSPPSPGPRSDQTVSEPAEQLRRSMSAPPTQPPHVVAGVVMPNPNNESGTVSDSDHFSEGDHILVGNDISEGDSSEGGQDSDTGSVANTEHSDSIYVRFDSVDMLIDDVD